MFKKFLQILILLFAVLFIIVPAAADEQTFDFDAFDVDMNEIIDYGTTDPVTIKYNEYNYVTELASLSSTKLKDAGYSVKDIEEIYTFEENFVERFNELNKTCTDNELSDMGYTSEQIEIIRDLDGNTASLSSLAAECTLTARADWMRSSTQSFAIIYYEYSWTEKPSSTLQDMMGVKWYNTWGSFSRDTSYGSNVDVWYYNNGWTSHTNLTNWTAVTNGTYIKFPMTSGSSFAKEADGSLKIKSSGTAMTGSLLDLYVTYGHQTTSGSYTVNSNTNGFTYSPAVITPYIQTITIKWGS